MENYIPDYEFDVPKKLVDSKERVHGEYAENGKMPVCFIGTNHTTGGNSGSPAIDLMETIGLNFDRVWEGTMSDIYYDPVCRNIMVDIRYVLLLWINTLVQNLISELKLVHPKKSKQLKRKPKVKSRPQQQY
jgi:hypothetical protein